MWAELAGVTHCLRVAEKGVKDVWGDTGEGQAYDSPTRDTLRDEQGEKY